MPRSFIQYGPSALLLSTFIVTVSSQFRQCYDPSGKPSASQPCTPNSVSHCCSPGVDTCLGDTLCLSQYGTLYVGGCTEKSWTGIGCPKYCARYLNDKISADIIPCGYFNGQWLFCCGINCCTNTPNSTWFPIVNTSNPYINDRAYLLSTSSLPSSSTASGAAQSSSTTSECPPPNGTTSSSSTTALGAGLGVGLGIPLLIALALLGLQFRKNRKIVETPTVAEKTQAGVPGQALLATEQIPHQGYAPQGHQYNPGELPGQEPRYELNAHRSPVER